MSNIALSGGASGTGTVTIAAPNTSTDRTLNLQDASGTLALADQINGLKNKIINGKMDFSQRGGSFAGASNIYTVDRWLYGNSSAAVVTVSQAADAPPTNEFQNSLRVTVTTADASIAAGDTSYVNQAIEGYNIRDLIGRTFVLSFWVRSPKTGIHCTAIRNGASDRSYVLEYTVNAANTWEYKVLSFPNGLITAGTWNYTNGAGLSVSFALACGSTFATTAGAWQTGNFIATGNQVNCVDTIGNIFGITGVQLEVGTIASNFEHRPAGLELVLCERYYEAGTGYYAAYGSSAAVVQRVWMPFKAPKRAAPTGAASINTGGLTTPTIIAARLDGLVIGFGATGAGIESEYAFTATAEL